MSSVLQPLRTTAQGEGKEPTSSPARVVLKAASARSLLRGHPHRLIGRTRNTSSVRWRVRPPAGPSHRQLAAQMLPLGSPRSETFGGGDVAQQGTTMVLAPAPAASTTRRSAWIPRAIPYSGVRVRLELPASRPRGGVTALNAFHAGAASRLVSAWAAQFPEWPG